MAALLEILKKTFDKFDALIILAAIWLFWNFDYGNLSTFDKFYIASFVLWLVMRLIRLYIIYKNERKG